MKNIRTKDFLLNRTVKSQRTSDDGQVVSYCIKTDKGFYTTRHRRFLRPLGAENDPKIEKRSVDSQNKGKTTDLPVSDDSTQPASPRAPLRRSRRTNIAQESVESQDKGKTNDLPVFDDITVTKYDPKRLKTFLLSKSISKLKEQSTKRLLATGLNINLTML